jgi:transcriptional regulator EpsA
MSSNVHGVRKGEADLVKLDAHRAIGFSGPVVSDPGLGTARNGTPFGAIEARGYDAPQSAFGMTSDESHRFLSIIWNVAQTRHHYELFLLLQGEIQHFISHQIFIAAWGDYRDSNLVFDVVSALPGVRTVEVGGCGSEVGRMLKDLQARWIANGRRKMLLNNGRVKSITSSSCDCALHKSMRGMQSILVHGVRDEREQTDSIYVALDRSSVISGRSVESFFPLVDPLIAQIDVAFQKVGALKCAGATAVAAAASGTGHLSEREREIMAWIAEGKTNAEIGSILGISSFTVKNHVQSIFRKLGAANRTEAVSKYKQYVSGR